MLIFFSTNVLGCIIIYSEKTQLVTLSSLVVATASVVLNMIFTARVGYVSAAVIYTASALMQLGSYAVIITRVLKMRAIRISPLIKTVITTGTAYFTIYLLRGVLISRIILLPAVIMIAVPRLLQCRELIGMRSKKNIEHSP